MANGTLIALWNEAKGCASRARQRRRGRARNYTFALPSLALLGLVLVLDIARAASTFLPAFGEGHAEMAEIGADGGESRGERHAKITLAAVCSPNPNSGVYDLGRGRQEPRRPRLTRGSDGISPRGCKSDRNRPILLSVTRAFTHHSRLVFPRGQPPQTERERALHARTQALAAAVVAAARAAPPLHTAGRHRLRCRVALARQRERGGGRRRRRRGGVEARARAHARTARGAFRRELLSSRPCCRRPTFVWPSSITSRSGERERSQPRTSHPRSSEDYPSPRPS